VSAVSALEYYFGGYIYEIIILPTILTSGNLSTNMSGQTSFLPDNSTSCAFNEFLNASNTCESCNQVCTATSDGCEYAHTDCTICSDVKCVKCDNYECTACMVGASIRSTDPDTCECDAGYYEDANGKCVACSTGCATCTAGDIWHC